MKDNHHTPPDSRPWILKFFFPRLTVAFFLRLVIIATAAYLFFSRLCIPAWINGQSMEPLFHDGTFLFCWRLAYRTKPPQRGDIVMVHYGGPKTMLLKRVVALANDTVAFHNGVLFVNGTNVTEAYGNIQPCDWELPERTVSEGCVYVVGDNRTMPLEQHVFGEVRQDFIIGAPLFVDKRK